LFQGGKRVDDDSVVERGKRKGKDVGMFSLKSYRITTRGRLLGQKGEDTLVQKRYGKKRDEYSSLHGI